MVRILLVAGMAATLTHPATTWAASVPSGWSCVQSTHTLASAGGLTELTETAPLDAASGGPTTEASLTTGRSPRFWLVLGAGVLGLLLVVGLTWLRWEDRS